MLSFNGPNFQLISILESNVEVDLLPSVGEIEKDDFGRIDNVKPKI